MSGEWQFSDTDFGGSDYPSMEEQCPLCGRYFDTYTNGRIKPCTCMNPRGKEVSPTMTKTKATAKKTGKKAVKAVKKSTKR